MKHINLLTCTEIRELPEWDKKRFPESEYDIRFNSTEDRVWDLVVVRQNVPFPHTFRCREGGVLYTSCEPPQAWPLPRAFTDQFDALVIQHPGIRHPNQIHHHGFLSWTVGRSFRTKKNRFFYDELAALEPEKTKTLSIVTSNLMTMPGHVKRVELIERLMRDFPGRIDRFGRGYTEVDVKGDALLPYRFHICIENTYIPDYWTEKFSDPVLAQSVPVYAGCTNLRDYFGEEGYIPFDIDDYDGLKRIVTRILADPEGEYRRYKAGLEGLRKTLMEKENLVPFLASYLEAHGSETVKEYGLKPLEQCRGFKLQYYRLRLKRLAFKVFYTIKKRLG